MVKQLKCMALFIFTAFTFISLNANAMKSDPVDTAMQPLKKEWAEIKYVVSDKQKVSQLESLLKRVDVVAAKHPTEVQPVVWRGTMLSTLASLKSGFSALSSAKKAKKELEIALSRNASAEKGYAHVILGALYSKVPGKPIGFGSKEKAKRHFLTALQMDPDGLDANFFYGEFLLEQGDFVAAKKHLEVAQKSPVNVENKVWDEGRRQEIAKAIAVVNQKIA